MDLRCAQRDFSSHRRCSPCPRWSAPSGVFVCAVHEREGGDYATVAKAERPHRLAATGELTRIIIDNSSLPLLPDRVDGRLALPPAVCDPDFRRNLPVSNDYSLGTVEVALSPLQRFEEFLQSRGKRIT